MFRRSAAAVILLLPCILIALLIPVACCCLPCFLRLARCVSAWCEAGRGCPRRAVADRACGDRACGVVAGVVRRKLAGCTTPWAPRARTQTKSTSCHPASSSACMCRAAVQVLRTARAVPSTAHDCSCRTPRGRSLKLEDGATCSICLCEYEAGEDVRTLPCGGNHHFHKAYVCGAGGCGCLRSTAARIPHPTAD